MFLVAVLYWQVCEYLFRRGSGRWSLERIEDPCDEDPVRYAVLASLVEALVEAFN